MSRKPGWMPRDNGLILLAIVVVVCVTAGVVALALAGRIEPVTAVAALGTPGAIGTSAIGRLSAAPADKPSTTQQGEG